MRDAEDMPRYAFGRAESIESGLHRRRRDRRIAEKVRVELRTQNKLRTLDWNVRGNDHRCDRPVALLLDGGGRGDRRVSRLLVVARRYRGADDCRRRDLHRLAIRIQKPQRNVQHRIAGIRQRKNCRTREPLRAEIEHRERSQRRCVAPRVHPRNLRRSYKVLCVQLQIDLGVITTWRRQIEDEFAVADCNIPRRRCLCLHRGRTALGQGERNLELVIRIPAIDADVACACTRCMREDCTIERHANLA